MKRTISIGVTLIVLMSLLTGGCSGQKSDYQYQDTKNLVTLVREASALVEKNGEKAFSEFKTEGSKWWKGETYIFVVDTEGNMLVHPDTELEGKNQLGLRDVNGKPIVKRFIEEVSSYEDETEGWSHYLWPKPGEIFPTWKTTFVKLVTSPSGKKYIVGSGGYDMSIERAFIEDEVKDAVRLIESEGTDAFSEIRDPASECIFQDVYVFVTNQDGTELVNPVFRHLEGTNVMDLKDTEGKYLVRAMFDLLETQDSGWIDYNWPKPGEAKSSKKFSFVTKAKLGDTWVLVGSGVYLGSSSQTIAAPGVTDTEILIGSSSALSGHAGQLGTNYIHGAMTLINQINEDGGIYGRAIRVISYDDQYDPPKAFENTQKLINEDKVFALFNYVGTPTAVQVIPIVEEAKVPLIGLFTGANVLREPVKKYIFNIRASYYQEIEHAMKYFVDKLGLKKVAVFYQADDYGMDGLQGTKMALEKRGLEPVALGSYTRGAMNVEAAVQAITQSDAEIVVMVGTYSPTAKFVRLVKSQKPNMIFHSVSFVGPEEFVKELEGHTDNVLVTQVVPPLHYTELLDSVEKYVENLTKYYPGESPSFEGLEGFVNSKVLVEGLRRCGGNLTREGLIEALESIRDYSAGIGAAVTFSENDHQGLDRVYLTSIEDGEFVFIYIK